METGYQKLFQINYGKTLLQSIYQKDGIINYKPKITRKMKTQLKLQKHRLNKLAMHLLNGKLITEETAITEDVETIDYGHYKETTIPYFIYIFIEAVNLFPGEWILDENYQPVYIKDIYGVTISSALEFFGLTFDQFEHIVIPYHQTPEIYGGDFLLKNSLPEDIANNIFSLVNSMSHNEN
jgi:hypothetical protein